MTTLASASLSRESRSVEPTWLSHSSFVLVQVWLSHAQSVIVTLSAVLEPKILLLHCRGWVTFWLQGLKTHSFLDFTCPM